MIAKLHIQTSTRNGLSYLKKSYATPPFKVADISEDKKENLLYLMLMCSSPGILDEDRHEIKIELEENCNLQLDTQSYQRLFNMKKGAFQDIEVSLEKNTSFYYLPHPTVPHENSIFASHNKINLSEGCVLAWGEVFTCGRKLNGEVFKFSSYHSLTEIFKNKKLVVKENLVMRPSAIDVLNIGQLEGFTHKASLIYLDEKYQKDGLAEIVNEWLSMQEGIIFGITAAPVNGIIIRILGNKAEQLHECLKTITGQLRNQSANSKSTKVSTTIS